ncbi:MAG: DUF3052 domain-containing protein [Acidimicrobiales bacterium]
MDDAVLATKLGVRDGDVVALVRAPRDFSWRAPASARVTHRVSGHVDVVLAFFTKSAVLEDRIERLAHAIFPSGSLWIAWPKRASGVTTDMTDHAARALALPLGLVDNKVCAIDETWTGLRFVWRRSRRS